uniref:Sidestep protein, putative n=1 Tax=Ixodes scapularis TaxID=6945 RepID=A0A1S4LH62_IXOSC
MNPLSGEIIDSTCKCRYGARGDCKHAAAVALFMELLVHYQQPWLCGCPDGLFATGEGVVLLELKCQHSIKDSALIDFTAQVTFVKYLVYEEDLSAVSVITSREGGDVALPCDLRHSRQDSRASAVPWFKRGLPALVYSVDMGSRSGNFLRATHQPGHAWPGRAYFSSADGPALLTIGDVQAADAGLYVCSATFGTGNTRNTTVRFVVVVPPDSPIERDNFGNKLGQVAGPYREGEPLTLACEMLTATNPEDVFTGEKSHADPGTNLDFDNLDTIKPHLRPTCRPAGRPCLHSVRGCDPGHFLLDRYYHNDDDKHNGADASEAVDGPNPVQTASLSGGTGGRDRVQGGRIPTCTRDFLMEGQGQATHESLQVTSIAIVRKSGGNSRTQVFLIGKRIFSAVAYTPTREDNGKKLRCLAEYLNLIGSSIEASYILDVYYKAVVRLQLGKRLRLEEIFEGQDLFLECSIDATQASPRLSGGSREGKCARIQQPRSSRSNSRWSSRLSRGTARDYTCVAINSEGESESNERTVYPAAAHEMVQVSCDVDAYPSVASFRWSFNGSLRSHEVQSFLSEGGRSAASYVPREQADYGLLFWWAANEIGTQKTPCEFKVTPVLLWCPSNCTLTNQTEEAFLADCREDHIGGPRQLYSLEVHDVSCHRLLANLTADRPAFWVQGVPAGINVVLVLYAANQMGRSQPVLLRA